MLLLTIELTLLLNICKNYCLTTCMSYISKLKTSKKNQCLKTILQIIRNLQVHLYAVTIMLHYRKTRKNVKKRSFLINRL